MSHWINSELIYYLVIIQSNMGMFTELLVIFINLKMAHNSNFHNLVNLNCPF